MNPMRIEDLEVAIDRRKAELGLSGNDYVLPNSGVGRTNEKRELLKLLQRAALERGTEPVFKANI